MSTSTPATPSATAGAATVQLVEADAAIDGDGLLSTNV